MRAICLRSLTILALAGLWQPSFAQDKPTDDGKGASPARIGTLSPDEARRAERARKRRAGAAKPAPAEVAAPTPAPAPAAQERIKERAQERTKEPARAAERPKPSPTPRAAEAPPAEPKSVADKPRPAPDTAAREEPAPSQPRAEAPSARRPHVAHRRGAPTPRRHAIARNEDRDAAPRDRPRHRRMVGGGPRWTPRVGDVVPDGVPLYPLRPAYGYAPSYGYESAGPGWGYPGPSYGYPPAYGYFDE